MSADDLQIKYISSASLSGILASVGLTVLLNEAVSYGNTGFSYMCRPHIIEMIAE